MELSKKLMEVAEHYGIESQFLKSQEELAEMIMAISKYHISGHDISKLDNIIEEMVDVEMVMFPQLKMLIKKQHGMSDEELTLMLSQKRTEKINKARNSF